MLPAAGEDLVDSAVELLDQYVRGEIDLIVPDLFWAECGGILWKAVKAKRCTREDAEEALSRVRDYGFRTQSSGGLVVRALDIALTSGRSVYDSLYIALAEAYGIRMVTADERLANAVANTFPVRWLGLL